MTADTSWSHRCRSWVAPPPAWAAFAVDREGCTLGSGPVLLYVHLWTLADSPVKRQAAAQAELAEHPEHPHGGWSHPVIAHDDVLVRSLALAFKRGRSTIEGWERTLRAAGLLARPSEGVVMIADVEHVGYLPESTPGIRTGGVSTEAPSDPLKSEGPTLENQRVDPQDLKGPTLRISRVRPSGSQGSDPQDLKGPYRKPDHSRSDPDQTLLSPDSARVEPDEPTEYQRARAWVMDRASTGQIARMQARWLVELERRMLGPDGLTFDEVVRIVTEHERQTAEARRGGVLRREQALSSNGKAQGVGIPELGRLWLDWSKCTAWRAAALGQGASVEPRSSFAGGTRAGLEALDEQRRKSDEARERKRRGEP